MYRRKLRASLLVLVPIFISGLASVVFHYQHVNVELNQKVQHFGASIADQLSLSVTDYFVNEDILSLNVVLTQLLARGHFDFASVYSAYNQLLAQVGKGPPARTLLASSPEISLGRMPAWGTCKSV